MAAKKENLPPIYEIVRETQRLLGVSQMELADRLGVSKSYLSSILNSFRFTSRSFAVRLLLLLEDRKEKKFSELKNQLREHIKIVKDHPKTN